MQQCNARLRLHGLHPPINTRIVNRCVCWWSGEEGGRERGSQGTIPLCMLVHRDTMSFAVAHSITVAAPDARPGLQCTGCGSALHCLECDAVLSLTLA